MLASLTRQGAGAGSQHNPVLLKAEEEESRKGGENNQVAGEAGLQYWAGGSVLSPPLNTLLNIISYRGQAPNELTRHLIFMVSQHYNIMVTSSVIL